LGKVLPDGEQRLLRRVLGKVEVTQDPARHGKEPIGDLGGNEGVRPLVAVLGSDYEIGIHASPQVGIGFVRCRSHGMGESGHRNCHSSGMAQPAPCQRHHGLYEQAYRSVASP
jgi:hypothetical protein